MRDTDQPTVAWWLRGATRQTLWARLARSRHLVRFQREVLTTEDDDDLMLDHAPGPRGAPRLLVLHGLEGSAHSLHTQGLAVQAARVGWACTVLNFRSCARDPDQIKRRLRNRRPRLYHSGETGDLDLVVRTLVAREPEVPLFAAGFSLGGNVLLKWLGEQGPSSAIRGAATLSVPYDLAAASYYLNRPGARLYTYHFLRRLKPKALDVLARFPVETKRLDATRIAAARTFAEFDEQVTAPLHGFDSAEDYYRRASSLGFLSRISVPTLCISSEDDPFYPREAVARARQAASAAVTFKVTTWGGHTGFVSGPWPWRPHYWAEELSVDWLQRIQDSAERAAG
ncbi:MAG TPA: alpha/beta fold hydrolase [Polyangia bacterium]|nr:alpha/beta fold hydrolase [Polyangia bacterium]